jgi:cytochrome b6-f complex iron-sulfur subunit
LARASGVALSEGFLRDAQLITRRAFFSVVGFLIFSVGATLAGITSLLFLRPTFGALYEEPPEFKVGKPTEYAVESTTVFTDKRVALNRDKDGFYAISLICTHLGCTPRDVSDVTSDLLAQGVPIRGEDGKPITKAEPGFKCPCHGSRYFRDAVNFYGPAPRPMDHVEVVLAPDGRLLIDRGTVVELKKKFQPKLA